VEASSSSTTTSTTSTTSTTTTEDPGHDSSTTTYELDDHEHIADGSGGMFRCRAVNQLPLKLAVEFAADMASTPSTGGTWHRSSPVTEGAGVYEQVELGRARTNAQQRGTSVPAGTEVRVGVISST
jgi:hypothetical protein